MNGWFHALSNCGGSTQITATFLAQTLCQVAGTALTVHRLAFGRQTEPFLGPFVSFDFGSHEGINTGWMVSFEKRSGGAYRIVVKAARATVRFLHEWQVLHDWQGAVFSPGTCFGEGVQASTRDRLFGQRSAGPTESLHKSGPRRQ